MGRTGRPLGRNTNSSAAPELRGADQLTNARLVSDWVRHHGQDWRPSTVRMRRNQARTYGQFIDPVAIIDATEDDCLAFRDDVVNRMGPDAAAGHIAAMRGLHSYLTMTRRLREDDPARSIKPPRRPRYGRDRMPKPMREQHLELAEQVAAWDPEMTAWLILMGHHGFRVSDVAWLKVEDVEPRDGGGGWASVSGKGGVVRRVPLSVECMAALQPFLCWRTTGPVFRRHRGSHKGRAYEPDGVSRRVSALIKEIGVGDRKPHSLRHRTATRLAATGVHPATVQKILGHADLNTTMIYTRVEDATTAAAVDGLAEDTKTRRGRKATMRAVPASKARRAPAPAAPSPEDRWAAFVLGTDEP